MTDSQGFSLIEVLVAALILSLILLGTITIIPQSGLMIIGGKHRTSAAEAAQAMIDTLKSMSFDAIPISNTTNFDTSSPTPVLTGRHGGTAPAGTLIAQLPFMVPTGTSFTSNAVEYLTDDGITSSTPTGATIYLRKTQVVYASYTGSGATLVMISTGDSTDSTNFPAGTATDLKYVTVKVWRQVGTTAYTVTAYPSAAALTSQTTLIKRL